MAACQLASSVCLPRRAAAARHGTHTELANWYAAIAARPALLWPDGIHPRPAGVRLYARVVRAAIKAGLKKIG